MLGGQIHVGRLSNKGQDRLGGLFQGEYELTYSWDLTGHQGRVMLSEEAEYGGTQTVLLGRLLQP